MGNGLKLRIAVAAIAMALSGFVGQVTASPINHASTGLATPDVLIDLNSLSGGTLINSQFAGQGIVFSSTLGSFLAQSSCIFGSGGCSNTTNGSLSNVYSFLFSSDVSDVSLRLVTNTGTTTFTALLNGSTVESFSTSTNTSSVNAYYGFSGIVFDELRYTINAINSNFNLDDVAFNFANAVSEPTALALLGIGLFGLGFGRRKA